MKIRGDPVAGRGEESGMGIELDSVMQRAAEFARRVNGIAAAAAFAAAVLMVFALEVHPLLSLLLALGVYAGITLLLPQPAQEIDVLPDPLTPEEESFQAARESSARIAAAIPQIAKTQLPQIARTSMRKGVTRIVSEIDKMLDVMEEDEKYIAAPLYATRLVGPFEQVFMKELKVLRRGVELADSSHQHFQSVVLPSFEAAAKEFYQRYHQSDVIDLAALTEILMYNLESIDGETEEDSMAGDESELRSASGGGR
jgi:hypothetical protein